MKKLTKWTKWAGVGAIAAVTMAGCTPQQEAEVDQAADTTAQTTENAGETAVDATGNAADATGDAAVNTADLVTITPQVKEALGDVAALQGSSIDVDNDVANNNLHLKGTVVDGAQKKLAEETAKQELAKLDPAGKYNVVNDLVVGAAAP